MVPLFNREVLMPLSDGFDCGVPFVVVSFIPGTPESVVVEGLMVAGSAEG